MVALFMLLGIARGGPARAGAASSARGARAGVELCLRYRPEHARGRGHRPHNHPRDAGRPLVEGWAGRGELFVLYLVAGAVAIAAAVPLGWEGLALVGVALLVSQTYSARPVRLSYRVAGAPLALGVAYVVVPYSLGIIVGTSTSPRRVHAHMRVVPSVRGADRVEGLPRPHGRCALRQADDPSAFWQDNDMHVELCRARRGRRSARVSASSRRSFSSCSRSWQRSCGCCGA